MLKFGFLTIPTHYTMPVPELAQWVESKGFDSLWFGEHSHIPVDQKSQFPGGVLPDQYKMFLDLFSAFTAAAVVTSRIKLAAGVCLVPEYNAISLAKAAATVDLLSNGRLILGVGSGWCAEELANHGVAFKDRWKVVREGVLAIKEIWNNDVAEYHGQFINFDPIWCWPKPVQKGGPKVLLGASSNWSSQRIADYCTGWFAPDTGDDLAGRMEELRGEMKKAGRSMDELDLSIVIYYRQSNEAKTEKRIRELEEIGFQRIVLQVNPDVPEKQKPVMEDLAKFVAHLQG